MIWRRRGRREPQPVVIRDFVTLSLSRCDLWVRDVTAMQAFMEHHNGEGHVVRVAAEHGTQTLFCTCGMGGSSAPEPPLVYREDDLFDSP